MGPIADLPNMYRDVRVFGGGSDSELESMHKFVSVPARFHRNTLLDATGSVKPRESG